MFIFREASINSKLSGVWNFATLRSNTLQNVAALCTKIAQGGRQGRSRDSVAQHGNNGITTSAGALADDAPPSLEPGFAKHSDNEEK